MKGKSWIARGDSRLFLGLLVASALFVLPSGKASAAVTGLTIQPVKFSYTLSPGQSVTDVVNVTNAGDGDSIVYDSVQDFVPVANTNGIQFVGRAENVTSVRDWVRINEPASFPLKLGQSESVNFTVTVPKDAEPGSHFGVMLFDAVPPNQASSTLKIGTQVGTLVLVTVPGNHLEKGKIVSFTAPSFLQKGPISFDTRFQNDGTVYFEPKGTITIKNIFGTIVALVPIQGEVILPTGARDISSIWPVGFLLGPYSAVATVYDGDGNILTTASATFFALPVWYILGFIVLFFALYFLFRFLKKNVSISIKK